MKAGYSRVGAGAGAASKFLCGAGALRNTGLKDKNISCPHKKPASYLCGFRLRNTDKKNAQKKEPQSIYSRFPPHPMEKDSVLAPLYRGKNSWKGRVERGK
jgi:hypothetical protein